MAKLVDIEGIGATFAEKLQAIGIKTQEQLLENGATRTGRAKLAQAADITEKHILAWVNRADLARINGVGEEFSDLLERAGVDSVVELAQRNAANLHAKMSEVNAMKKLTRVMPSQSQIDSWIEQAKSLGRKVHH